MDKLLNYDEFSSKKHLHWNSSETFESNIPFVSTWNSLSNQQKLSVINLIRETYSCPNYFPTSLINTDTKSIDTFQKKVIWETLQESFSEFLSNDLSEAKAYPTGFEVKIDLDKFENEAPNLFSVFKDKCKKAKLDISTGGTIKLVAKSSDDTFAYVIITRTPQTLDFSVPIQFVTFKGKKDYASTRVVSSRYTRFFKTHDPNTYEISSDIMSAIEKEFPEPKLVCINDSTMNETGEDQFDTFMSVSTKPKSTFESFEEFEGTPRFVLSMYLRKKVPYGILEDKKEELIYFVAAAVDVAIIGSMVEEMK